MTGEELKRIMKLRRIKTVEAAHAMGIHPQTIRNLWAKDEVPRIYLLALTSYVWALGQEPSVLAPRLEPARDLLRKEKKPGGDPGQNSALPFPSSTEGTPAKNNPTGGDLWSKIK